ncbi:hypothetical protein EDB81DRAFT_808715 [Dactylonectria macrodidyma]|uniref:Chorismate mutase domain-containing protein n=1 Tax=Dactylonectria macrodidyma TaxID=307937 RepID=A0A9P9E1M0_9HYPO|nr:hypothetical protein EDB81DRAFT_808715 [Dactylonectria macrodidyma]
MILIHLACSSLLLASRASCTSVCHYKPSANATACNYPDSAGNPTAGEYPYDLNTLSTVPVADICNSRNGTEELACARKYIDAIDEQLAYLYARRLGYAAVAGYSKFRAGASLNDPSRNKIVADGMAQRVLKYGGTQDAGRVMGGEGCQIYASLEFEESSIRQTCDPGFEEDFNRVCD